MDNSNILITFCVFAYNQADYIEDAIIGALNQNYSPLEIILSDDCSTDKTFSIMEKMVTNYKGKHKLILNKNIKNLGTCLHLNKVFQLANGELFILANGDDISEYNRTQEVFESYIKSDKKARSFLSNYTVIDNSKNILEGQYIPSFPNTYDRFIKRYWFAHGSTLSIHRELYDFFGNLGYGFHEDQILMHRSLLLGTVEYIPKKLINYRRHSFNVSGSTYIYSDSSQKFLHLIRSELGIILGSSNMIIDFINWCDKYNLGKSELIKSKGINKINDRIKYGVLSLNLLSKNVLHIVPFLLFSFFKGYPLKLTLRKLNNRIKICFGLIKKENLLNDNVFNIKHFITNKLN